VGLSELVRLHGGLDLRELSALGVDPAAVLDLSVNVNPLGPHPAVVAAIQRASLSAYPQPWATGARAALAELCGVDAAHVIVGHGSTELIWTAVSLLTGPLLIVGPTFSEPALAADAYGVPRVELRVANFQLDLGTLSRTIEHNAAAGVYLCQPNNPDGGCVPAAQLRELCEAHPSCLFVLDQAFLSLSTRHADAALRFPDNVLLVRSMTKEHALPGLRVGYALGAPALIERLDARRPSWMVSGLAEAAIIEACAQHAYVAEVRSYLLAQRQALAAASSARVIPSTTSYCLLHVGDADGLRTRLLTNHAIAVRSCSSFGLPEYIRVAACSDAQRLQLMAALQPELAR
jgi:histidinol-phosphate/aromatic aminotransferase/cobyric acid decarboxylase-like protein